MKFRQIVSAWAMLGIFRPITYLRALSARLFLVQIACVVLYASIMLLDRDIPNSGAFNSQYYVLVAAALLTYSLKELWSLWSSRVLVASLAFHVYFCLTPMWTGGMDPDAWTQLAKRSIEVHVFVLVIASMIGFHPKGLKVLTIIVATIAAATAIYSIARFLSMSDQAWQSVRLVTYPWPNENTGPAVLGIIVAGLFFYALQGPWAQSARGGFSDGPVKAAGAHPQSGRNHPLSTLNVAFRIYGLCICAILVIDIILAGTRTVIIGLGASLCLYAIIVGIRAEARRTHLFTIMIVVVVAVGALVMFNTAISQRIFRGVSMRDELFVGFFRIAIERFWLGHGIQNEGRYIVNGMSAAHNQLLTALLYGGFFGAALQLALYVRMIMVSAHLLRRTGSFALVSVTCFLIVHGFFETVIFNTSPDWRWILLWLPVAVAGGIELRLRRGDDV